MAIGTAIGLAVAVAGLFLLSPQTLAAAPGLVAGLFALLLGGFALFWRLVVEVDERSIRAIFGVGLIRKEVATRRRPARRPDPHAGMVGLRHPLDPVGMALQCRRPGCRAAGDRRRARR